MEKWIQDNPDQVAKGMKELGMNALDKSLSGEKSAAATVDNMANMAERAVADVAENVSSKSNTASMSKENFYSEFGKAASDAPTGTIDVGGKTMSASEYVDMIDANLPDDVASLENRISDLQQTKRQTYAGTSAVRDPLGERVSIRNYTNKESRMNDLQLYAAQRKYTYLKLAEGEDGTKVRGFIQSIMDKDTPFSTNEILQYLKEIPETYTPKADVGETGGCRSID